MFANRYGEGVSAIGAIEETPQAIERVRDIIIIAGRTSVTTQSWNRSASAFRLLKISR